MERDVRQNTNKLLDMVDEGILDPREVLVACCDYMSEDDVTDMAVSNGFLEDLDDEE